jgi:hypothetical protein
VTKLRDASFKVDCYPDPHNARMGLIFAVK